MSLIVDVLLHCSNDDDDVVVMLNQWLATNCNGQILLRLVGGPIAQSHPHDIDRWGGHKVATHCVWGGAINYCPKDGVVEMVTKTLRWFTPQDVVLILSEEIEGSEVYRPRGGVL